MKKEKKIGKFLYWTPRILSAIFVAFLFLMSLDVFGQNLGFWQVVVAFLMHNIPAFIVLIVVIISWKHELVGGIGFILAGLLYIALLMRNSFQWYYLAWAIEISGIAFVIGILFLMNWKKKRK